MIYNGFEIKDEDTVSETEDYKSLGSNDFDLSIDDLEEMIADYHAKEKELNSKGIKFTDLHYNFYANEYCNDDYCHCDADCEVKFEYYRPETLEEREQRIKEAKKRIDNIVKDKERELAYKKAKEISEINKAKKLLEKNGYKISL